MRPPRSRSISIRGTTSPRASSRRRSCWSRGTRRPRWRRTRQLPRSALNDAEVKAAIKALSPKTGTKEQRQHHHDLHELTSASRTSVRSRRGVLRDQTTHPPAYRRGRPAAHPRSARWLLRLLPVDEAALVQPHGGRYRGVARASQFLFTFSGAGADRLQRPIGIEIVGTKVYVVDTVRHTIFIYDQNGQQTGKFGTDRDGHAALHRAEPQGRQPLRLGPAQARGPEVQRGRQVPWRVQPEPAKEAAAQVRYRRRAVGADRARLRRRRHDVRHRGAQGPPAAHLRAATARS